MISICDFGESSDVLIGKFPEKNINFLVLKTVDNRRETLK